MHQLRGVPPRHSTLDAPLNWSRELIAPADAAALDRLRAFAGWFDTADATVEQFMATDTVFAGTPDDVVQQITAFNERVGGFGHLLCFAQGGHLDHKDTCENLRLLAKEVYPRVQHLNASRAASSGKPRKPAIAAE